MPVYLVGVFLFTCDHAVRRARPRLARPELRGHRRNRLQGDDRARRALRLRAQGLRRLLRNRADRARDRRAADLPLPRPPHLRPGRAARAPSAASAPSEIVRAWGDDTLDYFALRRDKNYFFSADGQSLIAYLYVRGTAMVAADPIGPPEDTARDARRVPRLLRRARLAGRLLRRPRGRRRALPRARHAHDLPRRRGDPPLRRVQPRRAPG